MPGKDPHQPCIPVLSPAGMVPVPVPEPTLPGGLSGTLTQPVLPSRPRGAPAAWREVAPAFGLLL